MSLAELLITIFILITLALVVITVILSAYNVVAGQRTYLNLQQEGATGLREITQATNLALSITDYPETSPTYTTGSNILVLKLNAIDNLNSPVADKYDYFVFYTEGQTLKLLVEADPASTGRLDETRVISNFVKKIIFRYNKIDPKQAETVSVTLILAETVKGAEKEIISQTSAYLRNK